MVSAIAECVVHVLERNLTVPVWQTVFQHGAGDVPVIQPFRHISSFVPSGKAGIPAARTSDDHLPVRLFRYEYVNTRAVRHIGDESPASGNLRSFQTVGHKRSLGHSHTVFDYPLILSLSLRIEVNGLCGSIFNARSILCLQFFLNGRSPCQWIDIHHCPVKDQLAFLNLFLRGRIRSDADENCHQGSQNNCSLHINLFLVFIL